MILDKNSTSYHAVLFDLDGTLIDSAPGLIQAMTKVLQNNHLKINEFHESWRVAAGMGSAALLHTMANVTSDHVQFSSLRAQFIEHYTQNFAKMSSLFPGAGSLIQILDTKNITWGIVTNKPTRAAQTLLREMTALQACSTLVCGDTLQVAKPNPLPILHACKLLNLEPKNCLYVGDTASDIQAAKSAGSRMALCHWGYFYDDNQILISKVDYHLSHPLTLLEVLNIS